MNSEQHVADCTRLARSRNQRTNCVMPNVAFTSTVLPPSRAGRVQRYAVMHDRRFHSSLRTKLVVRGVLFCVMPFSTFARHMDSTFDCAQAHCEKDSVARFALTWLNGLLPYLILCAILVTIGPMLRSQLVAEVCTALLAAGSAKGYTFHKMADEPGPSSSSSMPASTLEIGKDQGSAPLRNASTT